MSKKKRKSAIIKIQQRAKQRLTIGLLNNSFDDDRCITVFKGVSDVVHDLDFNLICFSAGLVNREVRMRDNPARVLLELINVNQLDGLLTFQYWQSQEWFEQMCSRYQQIPIVTILRHYEGYAGTAVDYYQGRRRDMQHLIEDHSYRKIAYIQGISGNPASETRYRAYCDALKVYGIAHDARLITPCQAEQGLEEGIEAVRILLNERRLRPGLDFELIVAVTDSVALGVLKALQSRGIRVPTDIAVVGTDNITESAFSVPPLTSVAIPWYELGKQAAEMLCEMLAGQREVEHVAVPGVLIRRRSCGCWEDVVQETGVARAERGTGDITAQRARLLASLAEMNAQALGTENDWAEKLLNALLVAVEQPEDRLIDAYMTELEALVTRLDRSAQTLSVAHSILNVIHRFVLQFFAENAEKRDCAGGLLHRSEVFVGTFTQQAEQRRLARHESRERILRNLGARLISTFEVAELMDTLADGLPQLGVPGCWLWVYDDPTTPAGTARLLLGYSTDGREQIEVKQGGLPFEAIEVVPDRSPEQERPCRLVVESLHFGAQLLGVLVFEAGVCPEGTYTILRAEISSALQGALLMAETSQQHYILNTFMATVPDNIYFKDRQGRIIRANAAYAKDLGLKEPAEEIGKSDFDFFPEEQARLKYEQEQAIMQTGEPLLASEEQNGSRWALTTKMPLRNEHGEIVGIFGISRDISALKQVEQELIQYREHLEELVDERTAQLRQINERLHESIKERAKTEQDLRSSEQQYRILAENVKDGIMIVQNEVVVFTNTVLATMLGMSAESLSGRKPDAVLHWGTEHPVSGGIQQVLVATPDGRELWMEIEQASIVWNGQNALLLTVRDVTSRKLKEQQLEEERARLHQENITLRSNIRERFRFGPLVGKSLGMQQVYEVIISSASSDVNVLVVGESGTGKELVARTIHQVSARRKQTFVPVNCASIPETLFEREFFGHRRGAFTGADRDKSGFFDRAHHGVLFLDEVTELTPGTQAKLLRVLQDGEYTPLGSNVPKQADVLIVAATNKDPQEEIQHGRLRHDFFYRICVIEIKVPPLRDRKDDLPLLIEHILEHHRHKQLRMHGDTGEHAPVDPAMLPGELVHALYVYEWPGNIRELQNILHRYLATQNLASVLALISDSQGSRSPGIPQTAPVARPSLADMVQTLEKRVIAEVLAHNRYRVEPTARELQIQLRTLYRKIKQYDLLDRP